MALPAVQVKLGKRSYPVSFGGLSGLSRALGDANFPRDIFVIADRRVWKALPAPARKAVLSLGRVGLRLIHPGEGSKCVNQWHSTSRELAAFDNRMRRVGVLALGGGVAGDLAGFVAATYKRGVPLYMVPTTLLAMVDSSVGGKTAIDLDGIKNRLGAFHQPSGVLVDISLLKTLPDREYRSGLAEVVKYGAILDQGLFEVLDRNVPALLRRDAKVLIPVIRRCVELKAQVVARDERDSGGIRAWLNFGHTVGHAVESALMPRLLHGEAVALGMAAEAELAQGLGWMGHHGVVRLTLLLERLGLRTRIRAPMTRVMGAMRGDKKSEGGNLRFALAGPLGRCRVTDKVGERELLRVLRTRLSQ